MEQHIQNVAPSLLGLLDNQLASLADALRSGSHALESFNKDPQCRVLIVQADFNTEVGGTEASELAKDGVKIKLSTTMEWATPSGISSLVFVKKAAGPFEIDRPVNSQVYVITLGDGRDGGANENDESDQTPRVDSAVGSRRRTANSEAEALETIYSYVHLMFAPLLKSCMQSSKNTNSAPSGGPESLDQNEKSGISAVNRKLRELELALLQYHQNMDIPEVNLNFHPVIVEAAKNLHPGEKSDLESLGLSSKLGDDTFLNSIQAGVNRWINEIRKVTRLVGEPVAGNALTEINFWNSLQRRLYQTQELLGSAEIELTLSVLKQAKRYLVTVTFETDHGLSPALKQVTNVMLLMKDFPIDALLSATTVNQIEAALTVIFSHLKKLKIADGYDLPRAMRFVEALSRDLAHQVQSVYAAQQLMRIPYEDFERLTAGTTEMFHAWDRHIKDFHDLVRDLGRRRGTGGALERSAFALMSPEHAALRERMADLREFRNQHQKLRDVISRVLQPSADTNETVGGDSRALQEIEEAFHQFLTIDVLDITPEGLEAWKSARQAYDSSIDRVEGRIISKLTDHLGATQNADEMFRVFSKYNALFFRARIRGAVQQFQMRLIETVKADVQALQEKFKRQYSHSEASKMSTVRDLPPISGAIIWARQISRQLDMYMQRVEDVLGKGWEQHVDGKSLKVVADGFRQRLDTQVIFDKWLQQLTSAPQFDVSGPILTIITRREGKELRVAFDAQIITLFKEVRNLEWLGFRVPYTIKVIAEEAKEKYPYAMALQATLRTYQQTSARIDSGVSLLLASYRRDVQTAIARAFVKGRPIKWDSDSLDSYVRDLAEKISTLQDKVEDALGKYKFIKEHLSVLKTCDYVPGAFQAEFEKIQKVIDELNLSGYHNLRAWVKSLDAMVEEILIERLNDAIKSWTNAFSQQYRTSSATNALPTSQLIPNKEGDDQNDAMTVPRLKETVYNILLRNQNLHLEPPLVHARSTWVGRFHACIATVCDLVRLQGSTYDDVFGQQKLSGSPSASGSQRQKQTYADILQKLTPELLTEAYKMIEDQLAKVEDFVDGWLRYQALWDMDASQVTSAVGTNLSKWQQLLNEIREARGTLDDGSQEQAFGPIVINYGQVQTQVNHKYDVWHKEFLARFAQLLSEHVSVFYSDVSARRSQLEQHSLDAGTAQVVATVTLIQEMRNLLTPWKEELEVFISGEKLLQKQRFQFPADWPLLSNVEGEWEAFTQLVERKGSMMEKQLPQLQAKILAEGNTLETRIREMVAEWDTNKPLQGNLVPRGALEVLSVFESRVTRFQEDYKRFNAAKQALDLEPMGVDRLTPVHEELQGLKDVWSSLSKIWDRLDETKETLWTALQPRKLRKSLDDILDELKSMPARIRQYGAFEHLQKVVSDYKSSVSLLAELKSDGLKERHWLDISRKLRLRVGFTELTLGHLWDCDLPRHEKDLRDVIRTAQGEMALEEFIRQVREYWTAFELDLANYQNRCRLIRGWDDLFAKLDEHMNSLISMKNSPYYKVFAESASAWEDKLTRTRAIFDLWIDVQRRWVYLEGIFFGSADIKQQLPKEYSRFQSIDNEFVTTMRKVALKPQLLEIIEIPNLQRSLERQDELMNKIQKALGEYLERQRAAFSRFYFVGDEDLLEIIGNSKDPVKIQRHLSKMFAGIATLDLSEDGKVLKGMISREGELVPFLEPISLEDEPRVNAWLAKVENSMRNTLAHLLQQAIAGMKNFSPKGTQAELDTEAFLSWVDAYPTQIVVLSSQVDWSTSVDGALAAAGEGKSTSLEVLQRRLERLLKFLAEVVLKDLPQDRRKKYEQLITELVHQRDVTRQLVNDKVQSATDFAWLYHMRYYYFPQEADPLRKLSIRVANASFYYGFEYLGVGERLVQTPLTDRCYLTLTQALHFRMGGNPFGPAGTGKTESVKALGGQLGRFVLVFNCDEHFDFQAMGRIFVGLCQVGAWGCFDEFNRLEERILSAVSQQIQTIQEGLSKRSDYIELIGKSVKLHDDVGIFVTMNPGYAGRSNLPDNLKQLFRSIAMVAPDRELIAQLMLFSQGITSAEALAGKIVLLFKLCEDQLSSQPHYDFGLRALKSVLVSAGNLKREKLEQLAKSDNGDLAMEEVEKEVLIRSVCDTVVPKLVASDIQVFNTLLSGVFTGTDVYKIQAEKLRENVQKVCERQHFVMGEAWTEKVLQLYQVQQLRHGVMMVGPSGTGKSSAWRVLLEAMELLDGKKGDSYVIDPKAISKDQLYGSLDPTTLEWTDGVFTHILRQVLNNVRGEMNRRHWIIFDGDVDPEWAENLNSVLDDNRLLTLPSGERLHIPSNVRIMIETETLRYATLATVSRCGMVWFSDDTLTTAMLFTAMLNRLSAVAALSYGLGNAESFTGAVVDTQSVAPQAVSDFITVIQEHFAPNALVESSLRFALEDEHVMEATRIRLLVSFFGLVSKGVGKVLEYNEGHPDFQMSQDHLDKFASKWLIFSILWGFGGSMTLSRRLALCQHVSEVSNILLPNQTKDVSLLDYEVQLGTGEWQLWKSNIPQTDLESHQVLSTDVVVTTVDTVRHVEVLHGWLSEHRPFILCGPPGSGKTMTLTSTLQSLPDLELASLNFSSSTTPELILKTFAQYCEYKRTPNGLILQPTQPGKWLVVFCDEINLPAADTYGTQRVITFMRQLTEQGGFWKPKEFSWVSLQRIQFVGACNPPTDPGRVVLSNRFLRHSPLLLVDYPAPDSLRQIYGSFTRALLKLTPGLRANVDPLTNAMVDIYLKNQQQFTPDIHPHYIYSPRELSRWTRALYEAIEPLESLSLEGLVRLVVHEALRLFMDRLVTPEEQTWCSDSIDEVVLHYFPMIDQRTVLQRPILYSNWLTRNYLNVSRDELRKHIQARLRVFNEEELNVQLVVFDSVLDHVLRIDRVLRQPLGHLLLVGESGAGKTVLSRFVAWMNGLSVFQIKASRRYSIDDFDEDLRKLLRRAGCEGEKICFIFDESNVLSSAFLERMNALLASGEVPGLFEGDDFSALMTACKDSAQRDGVILDTEEELFRRFTRQVQRNLHVVFTMNPANSDFENRSATSPALFNRCVVDWFGSWSQYALAQVGYEFTTNVDLERLDYKTPEGADEYLAVMEGVMDREPAQSSPIGKGSSRGAQDLSKWQHRDAVVAAIVHLHNHVIDTNKQLAKKQGGSGSSGKPANFISPRDYLDFIHHFVNVYAEKRTQLEDQQLHLNNGLDKLRITQQQVSELQESLSGKEKDLKAKDKLANDKLQQMVKDQNIAERSKANAEKLSAELAVQDKFIQERQAIVQRDLAQAEPALVEAQQSVGSIRKTQLDEIRALARPPPAVQLTMEAVCVMLGEKSVDWGDIRKFIRKDDFISMVVNFKSDSLTPKLRDQIQKKYLQNDEFEYEKVNRASKACGPLCKWIVSQVNYSEILNRVQPLRDEVTQLEDQSSSLREQVVELQRDISHHEESIAKYKQEYAELINETQTIKSEMERVQTKVERSTALLANLSHERHRWEQSSESFQMQMSTLVGDSLLASGFLTYIGFLDQRQRQILLQDWRDVLSSLGVQYREDCALIEYLSKPNERLQWHAHSLPTDDLCIENAIILSRFNRYPLVIDPSNQATEFFMNKYREKKIVKTSFLDASFMKVLGSALRFGTPLLVQDVESIDPVLNPVLNKEFHKTGGRVLVRVGEEDIDFSPDFVMFMTTRDPSCRFTPDLCSRVTFVNFTVTPASLHSQCLTRLLRAERPDVDKKRSDLLKLQGEYQAKLRDLEDSLLDKLNSVQGNILDDDSVINALETLKAEAAQVTMDIGQTEAVMAEVNKVTKYFDPLATACTRVYFALEQLREIHFLYQYSLQFFLTILDYVLADSTPTTAEEVKSTEAPEARLKVLTTHFFEEVAKRVARGLRGEDKLMFAVRLCQLALPATSQPADEELNLFFHGPVVPPTREQVDAVGSALPSVSLTPTQQQRLASLLLLPAYSALSVSMNTESSTWASIIRSEEGEHLVPLPWFSGDTQKQTSSSTSGHPESLLVFRKMIFIYSVRPDRLVATAESVIDHVFGSTFPWQSEASDLSAIVRTESKVSSPLLLCSEQGFDASTKVDALAAEWRVHYRSVAMGSAEGFDMAEKCINAAAKDGSWVLLRNIHLCPDWLVQLEKKLHNLSMHKDFRLFLTSEIHPKLPISLLRLSDVLVFEPPGGIKASLLRSFNSLLPAARMDKAPVERSRLYFTLAWFHAVVQERLRYRPVGWSKTYEFSDADQKCALDMIDYWVDATAHGKAHLPPEQIPWKALRTVLGESIYGGRIDNHFDQEILDSFLDQLFSPESYERDFPLAKVWQKDSSGKAALHSVVSAPEARTREGFLTWIQGLSNVNSPVWLGLPSTAETMLLTNQAQRMVANLMKVQDVYDESELSAEDEQSRGTQRRTSLGERPAWMKHLHTLCATWLKQLPQSMTGLERKAENMSNPLFRCLEREQILASNLLKEVNEQLTAVSNVCEGKAKATNVLRDIIGHLQKGTTPRSWQQQYAVAQLSVNAWILDFVRRVNQLNQLASRDLSLLHTEGLWLGGLFFPEAFVTASRQSIAQKRGCSLEQLKLVLDTKGTLDKQSAYIVKGLQLNGGSVESGVVTVSNLIRSPVDVGALVWVDTAAPPSDYSGAKHVLPVYLNEQRKEMLFEVEVLVESGVPATAWSQRGVAIIAWEQEAMLRSS